MANKPTLIPPASRMDADTKKEIREVILANESSIHLNRIKTQCPPGYLTRGMLKDATGLTEAELKSLEGRGKLKSSRRNSHGWALYSEEILEQLLKIPIKRDIKLTSLTNSKAAYTNEEAQSVYKLLEENKSLNKIVTELNIHPIVLSAIVKDYESLSTGLVVTKEALERIYQLPINAVFPIKNSEDLYNILENLSKEKKCGKCNQRPRGVCLPCAKEYLTPIIKSEIQPTKTKKSEVEKSTTDSSSDE